MQRLSSDCGGCKRTRAVPRSRISANKQMNRPNASGLIDQMLSTQSRIFNDNPRFNESRAWNSNPVLAGDGGHVLMETGV